MNLFILLIWLLLMKPSTFFYLHHYNNDIYCSSQTTNRMRRTVVWIRALQNVRNGNRIKDHHLQQFVQHKQEDDVKAANWLTLYRCILVSESVCLKEVSYLDKKDST